MKVTSILQSEKKGIFCITESVSETLIYRVANSGQRLAAETLVNAA
jgi:hypothetical protein